MLREFGRQHRPDGQKEEIKLVVLDSACKVFCVEIEVGEYTSQRVFQIWTHFIRVTGILEAASRSFALNGPAIGGRRRSLRRLATCDCDAESRDSRSQQISIGVFPPSRRRFSTCSEEALDRC